MTASKIFKEVISQQLSPLVLTGAPKDISGKFLKFLQSNYTEDQYLILNSLDSSNINDFKRLLFLSANSLQFIVVNSTTVTWHSWQKLLKILEDCTPNTQVIIISDGHIPKTIKSRAFRCHVPQSSGLLSGYSGTEAFSVGSWLIAVDTRNREQLLKSCQDWTNGHTALLMAEINEQLVGNSLMQLTLDKRLANPNRLIAALYMINENITTPTAHIYTGLRLMA